MTLAGRFRAGFCLSTQAGGGSLGVLPLENKRFSLRHCAEVCSKKNCQRQAFSTKSILALCTSCWGKNSIGYLCWQTPHKWEGPLGLPLAKFRPVKSGLAAIQPPKGRTLNQKPASGTSSFWEHGKTLFELHPRCGCCLLEGGEEHIVVGFIGREMLQGSESRDPLLAFNGTKPSTLETTCSTAFFGPGT